MTAKRHDLIILNGASSAGKTTLAAALQADPRGGDLLHVSFDNWVASCYPPGRPFDETAPGAVTVLDGFHAAVRAFVAAGNRVVLDVVVVVDTVLEDMARAFAGTNALWVAVRCPLDEIKRREFERSGRLIGMARVQTRKLAGSAWHYDIEVDTSVLSPNEAAAAIFAAIYQASSSS